MIADAMQKHSAVKKCKESYVYGGGDAGVKMADLLATLPLRFSKTITY